MDEKKRAKEIIIEIIRQSGGYFEVRNKLFKAFYFAHLFCAKDHKESCGYLSEWAIIKLPQGPGIDRYSELMSELVNDGVILIGSNEHKIYPSSDYTLEIEVSTNFSDVELKAIKDAVEFVNNRTARELTSILLEHSNSWNDEDCKIGEEMNIYSDLMTEEEFEKLKSADKKAEEIVEKIFGNSADGR